MSLPLYQPVYLTDVGFQTNKLVLFVATGAQFVYESVDRAAIARLVDGTSLKGDTFTKVDVSARRVGLAFEFPKGTLDKMTIDQVVAVIDTMVLRADDPKAPQFGTVRIGMTREQVITNLGKPNNVVDLADKQILVYVNLKVTLVGGKVTDVQWQ